MMPVLTIPIHEVNHCHGEGRGHPCDYGLPGFSVHERFDALRLSFEHPDTGGIGGTLVVIMPNTPGGLAHVETAFIVKELRGQGYGQKLYLAAAAEVKKRGYRGVASVVSHGRSADANALWRRLERTGRVRAETTGRFHVPLQVLERRR